MDHSKYFQTRYSFNSKRSKVWKAIAEYIQKHIQANASILEIGAGYCDFINQIKGNVKVAVDINANAKEYCNSDVTFITSSIFDIKILEKFDVIFASNFFEHFTIDELKEIFTILKELLHENGKLILIQPNYYYSYRNYWDDYTHKTAFSHNNLPDFLEEQGFKITLLKKKFIPFSFKSKLPTSYFLTKLYLLSPIKPFAKQLLLISEKNV